MIMSTQDAIYPMLPKLEPTVAIISPSSPLPEFIDSNMYTAMEATPGANRCSPSERKHKRSSVFLPGSGALGAGCAYCTLGGRG